METPQDQVIVLGNLHLPVFILNHLRDDCQTYLPKGIAQNQPISLKKKSECLVFPLRSSLCFFYGPLLKSE